MERLVTIHHGSQVLGAQVAKTIGQLTDTGHFTHLLSEHYCLSRKRKSRVIFKARMSISVLVHSHPGLTKDLAFVELPCLQLGSLSRISGLLRQPMG